MIEDLFNHLIDINNSGKCLEWCDFENVYQDETGRYKFPVNYTEPYHWGFKRNTLPTYPLSENIHLPINMNFIFLEFAFHVTQHSDKTYYLIHNREESDLTIVDIPRLKSESKCVKNEVHHQFVTSTKRFRLDFGEEYLREEEKYIDFSKTLAIPSPFFIFDRIGTLDKVVVVTPDGQKLKIVKNISSCYDHYLFELDNGMIGKLETSLFGDKLCKHPEAELVSYNFLGSCDVYYSRDPNTDVRLHEHIKVMEKLVLLKDVSIEFNKFYDDVLSELKHLHGKEVCHFDVKPDNIMYSSSIDKFVLIDFDGVQSIDTFEAWGRMSRTPKFSLFKESVLNQTFDDCYQVADLWEFGNTLMYMFPDVNFDRYFGILNKHGLTTKVDMSIYDELMTAF